MSKMPLEWPNELCVIISISLLLKQEVVLLQLATSVFVMYLTCIWQTPSASLQTIPETPIQPDRSILRQSKGSSVRKRQVSFAARDNDRSSDSQSSSDGMEIDVGPYGQWLFIQKPCLLICNWWHRYAQFRPSFRPVRLSLRPLQIHVIGLTGG